MMWNINLHVLVVIITTFLKLEVVIVDAVNSPQMMFYTPQKHDSYVYLESKYGYSATLKLKRPKPFASSPHKGNATLPRRNKVTEYVVLGPEYLEHGVVAIVQEMNLRTGAGTGCVDLVQFSTNESESSRSPQICGNIDKDEPWTNESNLDGRRQRTFFSPEGRIHVYFYSDHSNLDTGNLAEDSIEKDIGVEIVFTSYTVCPNPANSWKKLKACSKTDKMSCIYSTLFCDSKIDCGFPGEFGIDEEGCVIPYIYIAASITAGILLTAALIYLFLRWVTTVPKRYS